MARNTRPKQDASGSDPHQLTHAQQARDMLESFAVAFILMLLMRTCLGENYQIPTGSMAPTMQGRHMDVLCGQCGYLYRTGASIENTDQGEVTATVCPICRFPMELQKNANANHRSFSGDRIIVSKLAYWMAEPARWDVIVFKCPADAKVNYIKRLVGLPGETLMIRGGDIFVLDPATAGEPAERRRFRIARKPADKVEGMLQLVDDTEYVGEILQEIGWPSRWVAPFEKDASAWRGDESHQHFTVKAGDEVAWLRYRHLVPDLRDWDQIMHGVKPDASEYSGMLITDHYAYNDYSAFARSDPAFDVMEATNWVGDLAVESDVVVESDRGELLLDLVEGGTHYTCTIDVATGAATLAIDSGRGSFQDEHGKKVAKPMARTAVRGAGDYRLRFANVDDQLFLWVDDTAVTFDGPTTFASPEDQIPRWTPEDPGDFMPAGIGARGATAHVSRLRLHRDVYYLAISVQDEGYRHSDYAPGYNRQQVLDILSQPSTWATTDLFSSRRHVTFTMGRDQFFPLGDNSPQSKDARLWSWPLNDGTLDPPPAVDRELLIGKAVYVYWPHAWRGPWGLPIPNYQRMGFIH